MAMRANGACSASLSNRMAVRSSPSSVLLSGSSAASERSSATPPPATIPSSTAARVALSASSSLAFFSFSSTSVGAPTLITATPPASRACRSCSFSRSKSEVVTSICALISFMRFWIASSLPAPSMMVVLSLVETMRRARPKSATWACSKVRPRSFKTAVPPVRMAMSSSIALRRSPKPGAFTASTLTVPRILLTTRVASASPSTSSLTITKFLLICSAFSSTGRMSLTAEIL